MKVSVGVGYHAQTGALTIARTASMLSMCAQGINVGFEQLLVVHTEVLYLDDGSFEAMLGDQYLGN